MQQAQHESIRWKEGADLGILAHLDGDETLQGHFHYQLIIHDGFSAVAATHLIAIVLI